LRLAVVRTDHGILLRVIKFVLAIWCDSFSVNSALSTTACSLSNPFESMHVVQNSNALVKSKLNATIGFYGRKRLPSAPILPWLDAFWSFRGVGVCIIPERCMINKNRIQITSQPPWERLSFDLLWKINFLKNIFKILKQTNSLSWFVFSSTPP